MGSVERKVHEAVALIDNGGANGDGHRRIIDFDIAYQVTKCGRHWLYRDDMLTVPITMSE